MIIELANIKFNVLDFKPEKLIVRGKYGNYIREDVETDVDIKVTSDEIDRSRIEYESNDQEVCIETAAIRKIYETLLDFDAFVLHAASISVDGRAYAFSASSGTGKSTHMNLWKQKFEGKYQVVNGDRTIFRRDGEKEGFGLWKSLVRKRKVGVGCDGSSAGVLLHRKRTG